MAEILACSRAVAGACGVSGVEDFSITVGSASSEAMVEISGIARVWGCSVGGRSVGGCGFPETEDCSGVVGADAGNCGEAVTISAGAGRGSAWGGGFGVFCSGGATGTGASVRRADAG